ncbi:hypothetical protein AALP_AA7G090700 [Arabis alpina]|uniref:Uncharacterized protein n=1 Tax=Arabis alpina TaxID=50452 RepID=A0A087GGW1_ARAAL|nr:hypothetical protein AALP_AA7G090700 [Arabis alpina]
MGKRSFRELASGSAGASKASAPPNTTSMPRTISTPSPGPDLAPNTTYVPSTTPAPSTASAAKKTARMPSSVVLGMPASDPKAARSSVPLASSCSGENARKKAKAKAHETVTRNRQRSEPLGDDEREPKRPRTDPPSPSARVSQSVFDEDAAAVRLFATMVFPDDPYTRVRASFSGTMSRAGLKFLAFEKQKRRTDDYAKGELAAKTERNKYAEQLEKRNKELERALGDNKRLRVENEKLAKKLETAKKDASNSLDCLTKRNEKVPRLEDELPSLTADVDANVGDEEYFDKLMESLGECLDVVLPEDVSLEKLAAEACVVDISGSIMSLENAGGLLQMRIDSARLLKNLMISEDGRMSFAGEDEAEVTTVPAEDIEAEKTRTGGDTTEIEKTGADGDGVEKAVLEKAGLTTPVTSSKAAKDEDVHP